MVRKTVSALLLLVFLPTLSSPRFMGDVGSLMGKVNSPASGPDNAQIAFGLK